MKTPDVKAALRARFIAPEWSLFFEVADATGSRQSRWADAVAMNLYPSRGLEIHGFEIKVSRSDWLRELKDPTKSAPVQRYCDRWWIICPDGVIKPGELPPTWGHYDVKPGGVIRQVVAAPKLDAQVVTKEFMAALVRRAGAVDVDVVRTMVDAEVERQRSHDRNSIEREIESRAKASKRAIEQMAEIATIVGANNAHWINSKEIGAAVKYVMDTGVLNTYAGIGHMRNIAAKFAKDIDAAMPGLPPSKD
ncbi:hypothetical protein [Pseudomonas sp.]|uniref:hypothetical protein n=1 Tax=Pseudomonas sp. TaxID=306 RepID=UPI003FD7E040